MYSFHVGIRIGFEQLRYRVEEDGGSVEGCVTILNSDGCIASTAIPFLLTVSTFYDSAGMYIPLYSLKSVISCIS